MVAIASYVRHLNYIHTTTGYGLVITTPKTAWLQQCIRSDSVISSENMQIKSDYECPSCGWLFDYLYCNNEANTPRLGNITSEKATHQLILCIYLPSKSVVQIPYLPSAGGGSNIIEFAEKPAIG